MVVHSTIIDGVFVNVLSSTRKMGLGSPELFIVTKNLLAFNRGTNRPLGMLPKFLVTLG